MVLAIGWLAASSVWAQREAGVASLLPAQFELTSGYVHSALGFIHRDRWLDKMPSFRLTLVRDSDFYRYQIGGVTVQVPNTPIWLGYEYLVNSEVMGTAQWMMAW